MEIEPIGAVEATSTVSVVADVFAPATVHPEPVVAVTNAATCTAFEPAACMLSAAEASVAATAAAQDLRFLTRMRRSGRRDGSI